MSPISRSNNPSPPQAPGGYWVEILLWCAVLTLIHFSTVWVGARWVPLLAKRPTIVAGTLHCTTTAVVSVGVFAGWIDLAWYYGKIPLAPAPRSRPRPLPRQQLWWAGPALETASVSGDEGRPREPPPQDRGRGILKREPRD